MPTTYAIPNGATAMAVTTYTGNSTYPRTITNGGNNALGTTFQPDFVWVKSRSIDYDHILYDSVRGTGTSKSLVSNNTTAEGADAVYANLSAFESNGFTVGTTSATNVLNNNNTYVAWQWKAGGAAVSNTSGSITSSVSANTTAGFSVVTFTNPSSGSGSIGHGLGVKPAMIIVKARSNTSNWTTAHQSLGAMASTWINLDSTAAAQTSSNIWGGEPTSSVFYCGTGIQVASATMVAYCWAEIAGYSKAFTYVGNSSTDGSFVYFGFRPRFILHKASSTTSQWMMWDTSRNTYNVLTNAELLANSSAAEGSGAWGTEIDILSNGIKFRGSDNANFNQSGVTYIGFAFAENPFKYANAR